jgi:hypothetical protein
MALFLLYDNHTGFAMIISYIVGVIARTLWLPIHALGYVFGANDPLYCYNYYSKSSFTKIMESAVVEEGTDLTFEFYHNSMRETLSKFIRKEANTIVFHVDADEMLRWMTENKLANNHKNRTAYAIVQKDLALRNGVTVCKNPIPGITLA